MSSDSLTEKSITSVDSQQKSTHVNHINSNTPIEIEQRCKQCGMNNIISKPISKFSLETFLREHKRETNVIGGNKIDEKDLTILPYTYQPQSTPNAKYSNHHSPSKY